MTASYGTLIYKSSQPIKWVEEDSLIAVRKEVYHLDEGYTYDDIYYIERNSDGKIIAERVVEKGNR